MPGILKVCVGACVLLTVNINVSDGLSNGQLGTVVGIQGCQSQIVRGTLFIKFDNIDAGNSIKVRKGHPFAGAVPIGANCQIFKYRGKRSDVTVSRKQFPFINAHAITIHKSQSATYDYMVIDFDRSVNSPNPNKKLEVQPGHAYTGLSRAVDRKGLVIKNFDPKVISVNKDALEEMERLRKKMLLRNIWCHPLEKKSGFILTLFNIVSWNLHLKLFLSDPIHARASDIFCFTETYKHNIDIEELTNNAWTNVFKETDHGFSFCYKKETKKYVRELDTLGKVEMMSNLIELSDSKLIVTIVYRQSKIPPRVFLNDLIEEMNALPAEYRKIIVGDLNIDLRDNNLLDLIQEFST